MSKTKPPAAGKGRKKGAVNKLTASVKEAIEHAADKIGGAARLADWAKEAPENEKAFWTSIYPKLLPLQVTGKDGAALAVAATIATRPQLTRDEWVKAHVGSPTGAATSGN